MANNLWKFKKMWRREIEDSVETKAQDDSEEQLEK